MMEMQMENERVERLRLQRLGEDWIQAIQEGALDRLEGFCHPQITSQLLTPKRFTALDNASDLVAKYHQWFDGCTNFQLEASRVGRVGERLGIFYRFRLQQQEDWYSIEQQLYCTLRQGRVEQLHLLCSGFQLIASQEPAAPSGPTDAGGPDPARDELLEFQAETSQTGSTCALLTPAIRSKLRQMQTGQVLEVRVNDPDARQDVEAWSRLSGNALLKVVEDQGSLLRFFVKKK